MTQLLCEPEDRLGSQASASVSRPDSLIVQARRSGFMSVSGNVDGADHIKVISVLCHHETILMALVGPSLVPGN